MVVSSGESQVPTARRPQPATARPTTHPFARAQKSAGTISARGAAAVPVGKRARLVRGTLGNSNRRAVAELCGDVDVRVADGAKPASASGSPTVGALAGVATTAARSVVNQAPMIQPHQRIRSTILSAYTAHSPVAHRRRPAPARSAKKTGAPSKPAGKGAVPLTVLSPKPSRRQSSASPRSPRRPEALVPTNQPRSPESLAIGVCAEAPLEKPLPGQLQTLSEPLQQERPATPAATTPRFLHGAMDAAKAAIRRQALVASPKPGFRRPQSAPARQRKMAATARQDETREVTVADNFLLSSVDRRWIPPASSPVPAAPAAAQPGRYPLEGGYGEERFSGIGLSDQKGIISLLRHRMRQNRLAPALRAYDPQQTGKIDAKSFLTCMQQLDVRVTRSQVQWIFSALGANSSHPDALIDYSKFCEKLHAETRVGMARNAHENHAHSDKWIFRKEELQPGRPLANAESKAVALLPRNAVDLHNERTAATASWCGSTVMDSILASDSTEHTVPGGHNLWIRGKEGWVGQAGAERRAATEHHCETLRENYLRQTALTSGRQQADTDKSAQRTTMRTMKQNFRRDMYQANASATNHANVYRKYEVPRVFKATAEKYGEKCYMDWDKQELVIPAARDIPAHILDLKTEYTSTAQMFSDPANLDPTPGFDPIAERLGHQPSPLETTTAEVTEVVHGEAIDTPVTLPSAPNMASLLAHDYE